MKKKAQKETDASEVAKYKIPTISFDKVNLSTPSWMACAGVLMAPTIS